MNVSRPRSRPGARRSRDDVPVVSRATLAFFFGAPLFFGLRGHQEPEVNGREDEGGLQLMVGASAKGLLASRCLFGVDSSSTPSTATIASQGPGRAMPVECQEGCL